MLIFLQVKLAYFDRVFEEVSRDFGQSELSLNRALAISGKGQISYIPSLDSNFIRDIVLPGFPAIKDAQESIQEHHEPTLHG